jgi:Ca2+-binding RTX toxin-like protein
MRFVNCLNRFHQCLRRQPRSRRSRIFHGRPTIELLEDRMVPSTLDVNGSGAGFAHYLASSGVANDVTLSQRLVLLAPAAQPGTIPLKFGLETVITDTAETINVTGTDASAFAGSGTNQVTTLLPLQSLLVDVLDGNDTVNVQAINYNTTVRHIGPGIDTVNVGAGGSLQGIQASLGVTEAGVGSSTKLNVDDTNDPATHNNVLLAGGQIANLAPALIDYTLFSSSDAVTVSGGSGTNNYLVENPQAATTLLTGAGTNHVNVQDTVHPLTVQGTGGSDTVTVGSLAPAVGGNQGFINGAVTVSNKTNSTTLIVDDSTDPNRTVTIGPNSIQFAGIGSPIHFLAGVKTVDVLGGINDTYLVQTGSSTTPVFIPATGAASTVVSGPGSNDWTITGINNGTLHNVTFANVPNLRGGPASSADTFHFNDKAAITGSIQGAGSPFQPATLDYSKYTSLVTVDLKLNLAQAGGINTSVVNIQNVTGGQGNNILVGNGNNVLTGGSGRDLLISGGGNSTLQSGSGEAILIGAHYIFDTNLAALDAILAEWSRPIPYAARVHDLIFGGGLNGPFVLNTATVFPQPGSTRLTSGLGLDFLIRDGGDVLTHAPRPGETVLTA